MEEKVESRVASGPSSPSRSGGDAAKLCFGAEGAERESRVASREPELGPDPCLPPQGELPSVSEAEGV